MCEDYRAGASIDLEHDKADLDKKIACPVLALWGAKAPMGRLYDVLAIWRERAQHGEAADRCRRGTTCRKTRPTSWPRSCARSCAEPPRRSRASAAAGFRSAARKVG